MSRGTFTRYIVSDQENSRKHALECLRLESACRQLAGDAHNLNLKKHFVRMAGFWSGLADLEPIERRINGSNKKNI